jgi:hypothetical protein
MIPAQRGSCIKEKHFGHTYTHPRKPFVFTRQTFISPRYLKWGIWNHLGIGGIIYQLKLRRVPNVCGNAGKGSPKPNNGQGNCSCWNVGLPFTHQLTASSVDCRVSVFFYSLRSFFSSFDLKFHSLQHISNHSDIFFSQSGRNTEDATWKWGFNTEHKLIEANHLPNLPRS